jgi:hypothetical protein
MLINIEIRSYFFKILMKFLISFVFRRNTNRTEYKTVDLETFEERRTRWRSIRIIYLTMFVMSTGFTIILTGVWPYLKKVTLETDTVSYFTLFISLSLDIAAMSKNMHFY